MKAGACSDFERHAVAWLDGEVTPAERAAAEAHLASCAACREFITDLRAISHRLRAVAAQGAPEPRVLPLRARLEVARRERVSVVRFLRGVAAAAALVLLSATAILWWRGGVPGEVPVGDAASLKRDTVMELVLSDPAWGTEYWMGSE